MAKPTPSDFFKAAQIEADKAQAELEKRLKSGGPVSIPPGDHKPVTVGGITYTDGRSESQIQADLEEQDLSKLNRFNPDLYPAEEMFKELRETSRVDTSFRSKTLAALAEKHKKTPVVIEGVTYDDGRSHFQVTADLEKQRLLKLTKGEQKILTEEEAAKELKDSFSAKPSLTGAIPKGKEDPPFVSKTPEEPIDERFAIEALPESKILVNPVLIFKEEFRPLTEFSGYFIEDQVIDVNISLVEYTVTFHVNKKLISKQYWDCFGDVSLEDLNEPSRAGQINKMIAGLRELYSKLDHPFIPNILETYKAYLQGRIAKRNCLPLADRIKWLGPHPETQNRVMFEATKTSLIEQLKSSYASNLNRVFDHSGAEIICLIMLASRGVGPPEIAFTNAFLKKQKYRFLTPYTIETRQKVILYFANSMPKGFNISAIESWKRALGKVCKVKRDERFRISMTNCVRFFLKQERKKDAQKKGMSLWVLRIKLLFNRIRKAKFEKNWKLLMKVYLFIRKMKASAEPLTMIEPHEPPSPKLESYVKELDKRIEEKNRTLLLQLSEIQESINLSDAERIEAKKHLQIQEEAIDVLRKEMLNLALESKADLQEIKSQVHAVQNNLGDLRQTQVDIRQKTAEFEEQKKKIEELFKNEVAKANKSTEDLFKEHCLRLKNQVDNIPEELKFNSRAVLNECTVTKKECGDLLYNFRQLGTEKMKLDMQDLTNNMKDFTKHIPNLEYRMAEMERITEQQKIIMDEARKLSLELKYVAQENRVKLAQEQRREEDRRMVEVNKLRRQGKSKASATLAVARQNTRTQKIVGEELNTVVPRISGFVQEWNSLKNGDLFSYRGELLEIHEKFNPSIRIRECGQMTAEWEAQKLANEIWYLKGKTE